MNWRDDGWYVLMIALRLDVTPQAVLDMEWPEIQEKLGEDGIYRVARGMGPGGNPDWYTPKHIKDLRERGKL